jgi:hypothetical protein
VDNDRFFRHDFGKAVRTFAVTKELLVWEADLAVCKAFPLSLGDIFGNGTAFFLGKARHDGQQQFTLAVKGVDVLFFKVDFYAFCCL